MTSRCLIDLLSGYRTIKGLPGNKLLAQYPPRASRRPCCSKVQPPASEVPRIERPRSLWAGNNAKNIPPASDENDWLLSGGSLADATSLAENVSSKSLGKLWFIKLPARGEPCKMFKSCSTSQRSRSLSHAAQRRAHSQPMQPCWVYPETALEETQWAVHTCKQTTAYSALLISLGH